MPIASGVSIIPIITIRFIGTVGHMTHSMDMPIHPGIARFTTLLLAGDATECTHLTVGDGDWGIRPIIIIVPTTMEDTTEVIMDGAVITTPTMGVITEITIIIAEIRETIIMVEGLPAPPITEDPTTQEEVRQPLPMA